jgi:hypothetical protein
MVCWFSQQVKSEDASTSINYYKLEEAALLGQPPVQIQGIDGAEHPGWPV